MMKHKVNDVSSSLSLKNKTIACAAQSVLVSGVSRAGENIETHMLEIQRWHERSKAQEALQ